LEADPDQWHALTITHLQAQRSMMLRFGFLAAAEKRLRRELELRQSYQPNDATALVEGYRALGDLIREQGRPAEALPILHHALLLSRISGLVTEAALISYTHDLALGYLEDREFDAAIEAALEMISAAESAAERDHIDISEHLIAAASILYQTGRIQQAIAYQARVVKLIEKEFGPASERLIDPLRFLTDSQQTLQQYDSAIANIRRALAIARNLSDFSPSAMAQILGWYGSLLTETRSLSFSE
jgi:tetratricopeptide (TPR) repeat protein